MLRLYRFRYQPCHGSSTTGLPTGAVVAITATGINPNVLLVIEARENEQKNLRWHYAFARLNGTSGQIRLDGQPVWEFHEPAQPGEDLTNTYFFLERDLP